MARGTLRIYLGASPGVGKTYTMLGEGVRRSEPRHRRRDRCRRDPRPRQHRRARSAISRSIPLTEVEYRGTMLQGDGRRRHPAPQRRRSCSSTSTPTPTPRVAQREALAGRRGAARRRHRRDLDAQHPASRVAQRRDLPDHRDHAARDRARRHRAARRPARAGRHDARGAAPPDGPRQHLSGRTDRRRDGNYFRAGNLGALRELALLWVADRVEESLHGYLDAHGIADTWETRERVVVGITGRPGGEALIRRASTDGGARRAAT